MYVGIWNGTQPQREGTHEINDDFAEDLPVLLLHLGYHFAQGKQSSEKTFTLSCISLLFPSLFCKPHMCVRTDRLVKTKILEMVWANRVIIKTIAARRSIAFFLSITRNSEILHCPYSLCTIARENDWCII